MLTGLAGDCVSGSTTLAGSASCDVRVQFNPSASDSARGRLSVSASPGGNPSSALLGNGISPAVLTPNISSATFGQVEVGVLSTTSVTWTLTNTGDLTSSVPTLVLSSAEIEVSGNTCTSALAPGEGCSMALRFRPDNGGARSSTATVSVLGSSVTLTASATGAWRVTVSRVGTSGTITSVPSGIACAPPATSCTGLFAGSVTFQARTTNGSGAYFGAWSGSSAGTCANGPYRDCVVNVDGPQALTGSFVALNSNLVFVSSATYPSNLGGTAPYDAACNQLATSAGINNAAGTDFIAWMSDATSTAAARSANTSGWIRMDGRVFASRGFNLLISQTILNPVRYTETGADAGDIFLQTGTLPGGSLGATCLNWTSTSSADQVMWGNSMGGPNLWSSSTSTACSAVARNLLCMMRKFNTGPVVATFSGKRVWLSATFMVGVNHPDTVCNIGRPLGVVAGRALIARTTSTAASLLDMTQMYVRLDGQEVGTGLELSAGQTRNGIWQSWNGSYVIDNSSAWTGSTALDQLGTTASTCGNWVDSSQTAGIAGTSTSARARFWSSITQPCNATVGHVYCYEL